MSRLYLRIEAVAADWYWRARAWVRLKVRGRAGVNGRCVHRLLRQTVCRLRGHSVATVRISGTFEGGVVWCRRCKAQLPSRWARTW